MSETSYTTVLREICATLEAMLESEERYLKTYTTVRLALAESLVSNGEGDEAQTIFIDIIRRSRGPNALDMRAPGVSEKDVRQEAGPQPIWHSIDLGGDLFIEGARKTARVLAGEILRMDFPGLTGKTVLDVGAWGGFFSFECERRNAKQVTALDYHSWITDFAKINQWVREERAAGRIPDTYNPPDYVRDFEQLPGRKPFDIACGHLNSSVVPRCRDFLELNPLDFGTFDVVLFLGVLYHLTDPHGALKKVYDLCNECAVIETHGYSFPELPDVPIWQFYADDKINKDKTTWWGPNEKGLRDMLLSVGFTRVDILPGSASLPYHVISKPHICRIIARAWK